MTIRKTKSQYEHEAGNLCFLFYVSIGVPLDIAQCIADVVLSAQTVIISSILFVKSAKSTDVSRIHHHRNHESAPPNSTLDYMPSSTCYPHFYRWRRSRWINSNDSHN